MNALYVRQALEIILNPNILVNLVSRRVRQLNIGGRGTGQPLLVDATNLAAADIALLEIIEGKMSFEMPEVIPLTRPSGKNHSLPQHWSRVR